MALFYQHNINDKTRVAIWKIEEPEEFFRQKIELINSVTHPYKRLQHLAGRYLLPTLFEDFPHREILIANTRKPFLEDDPYRFSIAHCGNFAAAIVSSNERVGVDLELISPRIVSISPKFLNTQESNFLKEWRELSRMHMQLATVIWCAKEAVFKWYGEGQVDFRKHIQLEEAITFHPSEWMKLTFSFRKHGAQKLTIKARVFDPVVLAYVVSH